MKKIVLFFFIFSFQITFSQGGFQITNKAKKVKIPFQLVNNLIVIPVSINGVALNFLLDTGVENTILFSLEKSETVEFNNVEKIAIKGLGNGLPIEALRSKNNNFTIQNFTDRNHEVYIILDDAVNFSSQLGIPVHGIIGYHFFKNHLIDINYKTKIVTVYQSEVDFPKRKWKNYTVMPITIELEKPYLQTRSKVNATWIDTKVLIDSGNSDAIWLFTSDAITCPPDYFDDFLGRGFSGDIFGKRSRIEEFAIDKHTFLNPTASFPYKEALSGVDQKQGRNGSLGAEILKRFHVIFDYHNKKIYLQENDFYEKPFHYNMSGMDVEHAGLQYVEEKVELATLSKASNELVDVTNESPTKFRYQFVLKPMYKVANVRPDSPAALAGIQKGDILKRINKILAYRYKLQDIINLLQSEEGEWVSVEFERNGKVYKTKFQLQKRI